MITYQFLARGVGPGSFLLSIVALFIVLGLFTVISSGIAALLTVILFWFLRDSPILVVATSAALCVSLSMLGAGAYSLDALLFGRRRVIPEFLGSVPLSRHLPFQSARFHRPRPNGLVITTIRTSQGKLLPVGPLPHV
jgi:hypothetical protein